MDHRPSALVLLFRYFMIVLEHAEWKQLVSIPHRDRRINDSDRLFPCRRMDRRHGRR